MRKLERTRLLTIGIVVTESTKAANLTRAAIKNRRDRFGPLGLPMYMAIGNLESCNLTRIRVPNLSSPPRTAAT